MHLRHEMSNRAEVYPAKSLDVHQILYGIASMPQYLWRNLLHQTSTVQS
jgi:hypothetical protein